MWLSTLLLLLNFHLLFSLKSFNLGFLSRGKLRESNWHSTNKIKTNKAEKKVSNQIWPLEQKVEYTWGTSTYWLVARLVSSYHSDQL